MQGAQVLINGKHIGTTPYTGNIHRGSDTSLTIAMEGFRSKTVMLSNTIEPIFFGNLICGGTTGMVIDYSTDAMFRYAPNNIQIDLEQE